MTSRPQDVVPKRHCLLSRPNYGLLEICLQRTTVGYQSYRVVSISGSLPPMTLEARAEACVSGYLCEGDISSLALFSSFIT